MRTSIPAIFFLLLTCHAFSAEKINYNAITGVTIVTGNQVITGATLLFTGGKIKAVGKGVKLPAGTKVSSEKGKVLIPGLIAADTLLSAGPGEDKRSTCPEIIAIDGFDYFGPYLSQLSSGTTCAYLSPGKSRLVPGQGSVVKLGSLPEKALVKKSCALESVLTNDSLNPPGLYKPKPYPLPSEPFPHLENQLPRTSASQVAELEKFLKGAGKTRGKKTSDGKVVGNESLTGNLFTLLREKKIPLRVRADTVRQIREALRIARENKLELVIIGGREAGQVANEIKRAKASVVWQCSFNPETIDNRDPSPDKKILRDYADTPALLEKAGVQVVISSSTDSGSDLLSAASFAVAHGFPREKALAAVTSRAASVLGISNRAGSIEKGKDADFLLLNGMPFAEGSSIVKTFVNGKAVFVHEALKRREQAGDTLLKNALVLTGDGGRYPETDILIEQGKIIDVGHNLKASPKAKLIDLKNKVVIPGIIDLSSKLGTHFYGRSVAENVPRFNGRSSFLLSPGEIIRPGDPCFKACVAEGVLGLLVRGARGSLLSGTGSFLLPGEAKDKFLAKPFACLDVDISGRSRLSLLGRFKSLVGRLDSYEKKRKQYEDALEEYKQRKPRDEKNLLKEPVPPGKNPEYELLMKARKRKLPLFVRANRSDEITGVVKLLIEEGGFDCTLVGAEGIGRAGDVGNLVKGVILTPPYRKKIEGKLVDLSQLLAKKGIPFALSSGGAMGSIYLRFYAGEAVRRGLSSDLALRAITSVPAKLLGISNRFGVIAKERVANLAVLDGDVFSPGSHVVMVFVKGNVVYKRSGK